MATGCSPFSNIQVENSGSIEFILLDCRISSGLCLPVQDYSNGGGDFRLTIDEELLSIGRD
jgi:hypothetical protein